MIKIFEGSTLKNGIDLVLKNRLFVSGWCMSEDLCFAREQIVNGEDISRFAIAVYFKDNQPIALCFKQRCEIQVFCKKSERKNGFASKCLTAIKDHFKNDPDIDSWYGGYGIQASIRFWRNHNIWYR